MDLSPASLVTTTIDLPIRPGLTYLKPFYVVGRRVLEPGMIDETLPSAGLREMAVAGWCRNAITDLGHQAMAYFAVSPPVKKWRRAPDVRIEKDFATQNLHIYFSARGFFDQLVAFEDAQCLVTELP